MRSIAIGILFLAGFWGCGSGRSGDPDAGAALYEHACASCHGADGLGLDGEDPAATGANLRAHVESMSDGAIERAVLEGVGDMEPLSMTQKEVDDVIAFLRAARWED